MTENQAIPQAAVSKPKALAIAIKFVLMLVVSVLLGTFVHYFLKQVMIINSMNVFAIWVMSFILALVLKISYQKPLFLIYLAFGSILVSLYPFGQGLTIYLLLLALGRWFKII